MAAATILFMSHEHLPCSPEEWIRELWRRYGTAIAVVGMGADGALIGARELGTRTSVAFSVSVSSNRPGGPVFAWGWGPARDQRMQTERW